MVKSETKPIFDLLKHRLIKNAPTTGKHAVQAEANIRNNVFFRSITHDTPDDEIQFPAHWFLFGLVSDGTAAASDAEGSRTLRPGDLLILSPSRSAALRHRSRDFRLEVVGIHADYFDTLPDGQPMYARLTRLPDGFRPPILHPDPDGFAALRSTAALFAGGLVPWVTYRRGIVRHLCSLFLLQVTELLHRTGGTGPAYVGRADEIFRLFKQAAVEHYRTDLPVAHRQTRDGTYHLHAPRGTALRRRTALSGVYGPRYPGDCRPVGILRPVGLRQILSRAERTLPHALPLAGGPPLIRWRPRMHGTSLPSTGINRQRVPAE